MTRLLSWSTLWTLSLKPCIAAPIMDYSRKVIASMGIAVYSGQSNLVKDIDRLAELIKKTCDKISADLGYLKV